MRVVRLGRVVATALLAGGWVLPARADLILNGGFEDPVLTAGEDRSFVPGATIGSAWTVLGADGTDLYVLQTSYTEMSPATTVFNAQEGLNSVDLTGTSNQGSSVGVAQTVATDVGDSYVLSFHVGRVTPQGGPTGLYANPATVDLSIDGGPRILFTNANITNGMNNWQQFTHLFTASASSTTISFFNGTPVGTNEAGLDNVSLIEAVPEPHSLALGIVAAVAFMGRAWRSRPGGWGARRPLNNAGVATIGARIERQGSLTAPAGLSWGCERLDNMDSRSRSQPPCR